MASVCPAAESLLWQEVRDEPVLAGWEVVCEERPDAFLLELTEQGRKESLLGIAPDDATRHEKTV